ncbi:MULTISPECIES: hypothetical protein [Streptomyces]|nr:MULTISPECIES: hypothetical protein [unclassified Streptomyces]WSD94135.1 hypothetical protein OG758_08025 [Streptomyces sp. NBC_01474]
MSTGRVRRPPGGRLAEDGNGAERMMREHVRRSHQALLSGWDAAEEA